METRVELSFNKLEQKLQASKKNLMKNFKIRKMTCLKWFVKDVEIMEGTGQGQ